MTDGPLYPLKFDPIFQYRLWGGRGLGDFTGRPLPDGPVGEAWILSDRKDHPSVVADGPLKGQTLSALTARSQGDILGKFAGRFDRFPLLLKFLDVKKMLSVQVHPRDDQAELIPEGESGKTEAWVVLQADAKARIYAGLKPHATAADLKGLTTRTADEVLASFKPAVGQGVLIEAGTVHALGDGVMVFEVQENSDVTFRLYDWDHVDEKTGQPRPLQVDQALASVDFQQGEIRPVTPVEAAPAPARRDRYFDDPHFALQRVQASAPFAVGAANEPRILVCIEGRGRIVGEGAAAWPPVTLGRGETALLPAILGPCRFQPDGAVTLLEIAIPERP